jgi:hypothetical protein
MQQTIDGPNWAHRFFIRPFTRSHEMYQRRNGNPDPHESRDPRQPHTAIAYQDGRLRSDLDLPTLLKAIYRAATVFSLGFLLVTMRAERNEARITPQAVAQVIVQLSDDPAIKAAFIKLLTPEVADTPAPPIKTPTKSGAKPKQPAAPAAKPKGLGELREGEMIVTDPTVPFLTMRAASRQDGGLE